MSDIIDDLLWRGAIAQHTDLDPLRAEFAKGPVSYYCGFDPTGPSLHVGHLVQVITLRRLQLAGNQPVALVGGATGLIGDPRMTGERTLNEPEVVAGWVDKIRNQIAPLLDLEGPHGARLVNNLDWTAQLTAIELLRDIGKNFRMSTMLAKETVARRLESEHGLSYTEFSYQVLQANDFLELHRRHGCALQTGGNDQWGNLLAGVELIRRMTGDVVSAFTTPLLTKADGTKFGKTESGGVWLDPTMTSPYAFYQFWLNSDDKDVMSYLKVLSYEPRERLEELEREQQQAPGARPAQRALAGEVTALVHGPAARDSVIAASAALFGGSDLTALDAATLEAAVAELPRAPWRGDGVLIGDLMADAGIVPSRSAARRAIDEGGAYVNNVKVADSSAALAASDLLHGRWALLRRGKKTLAVVERA